MYVCMGGAKCKRSDWELQCMHLIELNIENKLSVTEFANMLTVREVQMNSVLG